MLRNTFAVATRLVRLATCPVVRSRLTWQDCAFNVSWVALTVRWRVVAVLYVCTENADEATARIATPTVTYICHLRYVSFPITCHFRSCLRVVTLRPSP